MTAFSADEIVKSMTRAQKKSMLEALVRDLLPRNPPMTEKQRAAELKELRRRYANRHQAVSFKKFMEMVRIDDSRRKTRT
jgi:hypothetical protein